jgi:hypothetical protein
MSGFWQALFYVMNLSATCGAVTQSTHSTPLTESPILYGGNCLQAFLIALYSHGSIAFEILS